MADSGRRPRACGCASAGLAHARIAVSTRKARAVSAVSLCLDRGSVPAPSVVARPRLDSSPLDAFREMTRLFHFRTSWLWLRTGGRRGFRFGASLRARGPMSTRGQREAARTQAHVLTGRVRRWEKRWIRGGESSPDVLRWTPVVDANGRDVECAKNEKRDAFEVVPLAECVLAAASKPTAHDAVAGPSRRRISSGAGAAGTPPLVEAVTAARRKEVFLASNKHTIFVFPRRFSAPCARLPKPTSEHPTRSRRPAVRSAREILSAALEAGRPPRHRRTRAIRGRAALLHAFTSARRRVHHAEEAAMLAASQDPMEKPAWSCAEVRLSLQGAREDGRDRAPRKKSARPCAIRARVHHARARVAPLPVLRANRTPLSLGLFFTRTRRGRVARHTTTAAKRLASSRHGTAILTGGIQRSFALLVAKLRAG